MAEPRSHEPVAYLAALVLPAYLWSGWGAIASLFLLLAAWEAVSLAYGPLVMPDPRSAFATLWGLHRQRRRVAGARRHRTARPALGYALSVLAGSVLGLVAGLSMTACDCRAPS